MAPLKILTFPSDWNGAIRCDSYALGPLVRCKSCNSVFCGSSVNICICHEYCLKHCGIERKPENRYVAQSGKDLSRMSAVIAPFVNVAVCNDWTEQVLDDCKGRLNSLDPFSGLGVLNALLVISDDFVLLKQLLELGVNPERKYVYSEDHDQVTQPAFDARKRQLLNGGTAVHFAVHYKRVNCFEALVDVRANLNAVTADGKSLKDLTKSDPMLDTIAKAAAKECMSSLAQGKKYFAIRHLMRSGKVTDQDFTEVHDGKTLLQSIWASMAQWNFSVPIEDDPLTAFKVMSELKFRYGVGEVELSPSVVGCFVAGGGEGSDDDHWGSASKVLLEGQETIMTELMELKEEVADMEVLRDELEKMKLSQEKLADKMEGIYHDDCPVEWRERKSRNAHRNNKKY